MANDYHIPVLLTESIDALLISPDGRYVDVTFGAGGHSKSILKNLSAKGHLFGFDQDADAISNAVDDTRFTFIHSNYRHLHRFLRLYDEAGNVDGILADLGISSHQIDVPHRGFSFRFDAPLDMRMNVSEDRTAADVLHHYSVDELIKVFSEYGEVRNSKTLALAVDKYRSKSKFDSTFAFNRFLDQVAMGPQAKYYAQVYQALRIEVNDEMNALKFFLEDTLKVLKSGGRLAVISYHSLEDRLVKNLMKTGNVSGEIIRDEWGNINRPFKIVNKEIIIPKPDEQRSNPRSRSAKLRIAEKT